MKELKELIEKSTEYDYSIKIEYINNIWRAELRGREKSTIKHAYKYEEEIIAAKATAHTPDGALFFLSEKIKDKMEGK